MRLLTVSCRRCCCCRCCHPCGVLLVLVLLLSLVLLLVLLLVGAGAAFVRRRLFARRSILLKSSQLSLLTSCAEVRQNFSASRACVWVCFFFTPKRPRYTSKFCVFELSPNPIFSGRECTGIRLSPLASSSLPVRERISGGLSRRQ